MYERFSDRAAFQGKENSTAEVVGGVGESQ
jgi:hypothetical protein